MPNSILRSRDALPGAVACAPPSESPAKRWRTLPLVFASFAYFAAGLGKREASLLEAQDFGIACNLFRDFGISLDHSPLHFVFMNLWQRFDTGSFAFVRIPSAVFCAVAVAIVFEVAAAEAGTAAGYCSALLFALNPLVVDNARSMRMYALVLLLAALCLRYAQRYLAPRGGRSALVAWGLCSVLLIYTHLFGWLLLGPLALLIAVALTQRAQWRAFLRSARTPVALGAALLLLQLLHAAFALGFVQDRHARYAGISSRPLEFCAGLARTLLLGEEPPNVAWSVGFMWALVALVVLGAIALRRRGLVAFGALFLPGLIAGWVLSRSSQVEARYFNYLLPLVCILEGAALAKTPNLVRVPLLVVLLAGSLDVTQLSDREPPSDWPDVASVLPAPSSDHETVAVYPSYFAATLRRYVPRSDVVPIRVPSNLDHVLARGNPVTLIRYTAVDFQSMAAAIPRIANSELKLTTRIRTPLEVYRLTPQPVLPSRDALNTKQRASTLLITGTIGSGGYPWQLSPNEPDAFRRVQSLFRSAAFVLASSSSYDPPWLLAMYYGLDGVRALRPNRTVARALHRAGVRALVSDAPGPSSEPMERVTRHEHVEMIDARTPRAPISWRMFSAGELELAVMNLAAERSFSPARIAPAIGSARAAVGPDAYVVAMLPVESEFDTDPSPADQARARTLIDLGADVVVGMGGLGPRKIERYGKGIVAYSLGTLACPPMLRSCTTQAASLALRVRMTRARELNVDVEPLMLDDESRVTFAPERSVQELLPRAANGRETSLSDALASASGSVQPLAGAQVSLGAFDANLHSTWSHAQQWWWQHVLEPVGRFLPRGVAEMPRPCRGGFRGYGAHAVRRTLRSGGEYRDALELDPGPNHEIALRFPQVTLGDSLELAFGLADDRARPRFQLLHPQPVRVRIGGAEVVSLRGSEVPGWQRVTVDTTTLRGQPRDIVLLVESSGTHFPLALALTLQGSQPAQNTPP